MNVWEDTGGGEKEERLISRFSKTISVCAITAHKSGQGRSITTSRPDGTPVISIDTTTARVPLDQHKASA